MKSFASLLTCFALLSPAAAAPAVSDYPQRAVTILVPYPAGGSADALIRPIAARLAETWKQPVLVENRTGANGIIATQALMKAPADGYTVLLHLTGIVQNLSLYRQLPYDPFRDLAPLTQVGTQAMALAVPADSPWRSVDELAAAVRANPQAFSYGSFGTGSTGHIYGELLRTRFGAEIPHVPYRGEGPMLVDLISGRVPFALVSTYTGSQRQRDGSLRILAVTGTHREPMLEDVPTLAEAGYPGFDLVGWYGLFVPAGTPAAIGERIAADVNRIAREPEIAERMRALAIYPTGMAPSAFVDLLREEHQKWDALIRQFNITLE